MLALLLMLMASFGNASADDTWAESGSKQQYFKERVLPILKQHCYSCHSHSAKKAKGGLVLDSRRGWNVGGETGAAVIPGKVNESLLIQAVRYENNQMPPKGKLPAAMIQTLEKWVADGAVDPRTSETSTPQAGVDYSAGRKHWAFQPVRSVPVPSLSGDEWSASNVDRFIEAKLAKEGIRPVGDADRYTWLRRVTFDLTGLPPSVEQIRSYAADDSPDAKETVVDRLLASRAFGERWARHWLDLVGYADQIGTSNNVFAEHAWRYRDYVIDAYNNDLPYDRFIQEQIAGDHLADDSSLSLSTEEEAAAITALGFLVLGDLEIVEADKQKLLVDIVDQQLNKTGKAFLGMTLECARCHDHKFDPISQRDYYAMAGFFHGTSTVYKTDRGVWSDVHTLELPETATQQQDRLQQAKRHAKNLANFKQERDDAQTRKTELDGLLKNNELTKEERDKLTKERDEKAARIGILNRDITHAVFFTPGPPRTYGVMDKDEPRDMHVTIRGNPRATGDQVPRGFLTVVTSTVPQIANGSSGRRQLADWIVSKDNPLTVRVAVNRIWQKLFGEGLVATVDYFGLPGSRPTHPLLLDYLATRFVASGWSQKQLIRSLVLSRTYGLSSSHSAMNHQRDAENRLLWRMNRIRLDAEALRDALVFVSGKLQSSNGGPAIALEYPENVGGLSPTDVNPPNFRLARWRPQQEFERTVYLPVIRSGAQPGPAALRNVFDFSQPSQFAGKRTVTAVPTQALFLMNSPVVRGHAVALAGHIGQTEAEHRLETLWLTALNRPISDEERTEATTFLAEAGEDAWTELCHAIIVSNEFLMRL